MSALTEQFSAYLENTSPAFQVVQQVWTLGPLPLLILPIASRAWHMLPGLEALTKGASASQAEETV